MTVGPVHETWGRTTITVVIGLIVGALAIALGPRRPIFHTFVRVGISAGFLALIALHQIFGGVAFAWLFSAAVGMNLGSGGWTRSSAR